jgi:hypothetical protein
LARRGLTLRSWKSASCLRRKRFSAARARRECAARKARRTRSATTEKVVREQCATVRISRKPDMNAQDDTLQNVRALRIRFGWNFCGAQRWPVGVAGCGCDGASRNAPTRGGYGGAPIVSLWVVPFLL